jgi:uncharacterized protein (TIGR02300 family)
MRTVTKPELGTKRLCASCGAKFFDLSKTPITCPKCGTIFEIVPVTSRPRPDQARAARKPKEEAPEEKAELISLEEADAEEQDKKAPAEDTIIEEEEDTDVSDIIDADIEDEKET